MSVLTRRGLIAAMGCAAAVRAEPTRCAVCGGALPERYWNYEGKACCSPACVDQLRLRCSRCERPMQGRYLESDGAVYCSNTCLNETLPACEICSAPIHEGYSINEHHYCSRCMNDAPTCFSCGLPAAAPRRLPDGRETCARCARSAVREPAEARFHYEEALNWIEAWTGLQIATPPKIQLVDRAEMKKLTGDLRKSDSDVPIRGLYSRQTVLRKRGFFGAWKESAKDSHETIYIIDHLDEHVFRSAAAHELTHDLTHEHFPRLKKAPLWAHEGISQWIAAAYCREKGLADILQGIETCSDPDYGDGYRYFKRVVGLGGWSAMRRWMETVEVETLPPTAPRG